MKKSCVLYLFAGILYILFTERVNQINLKLWSWDTEVVQLFLWPEQCSEWLNSATMTKEAHHATEGLACYNELFWETKQIYMFFRLLAVLHSMPLHFGLSNMGPNRTQKRCGWDGESWCLTSQQTAPVSMLLKQKDTDFCPSMSMQVPVWLASSLQLTLPGSIRAFHRIQPNSSCVCFPNSAWNALKLLSGSQSSAEETCESSSQSMNRIKKYRKESPW